MTTTSLLLLPEFLMGSDRWSRPAREFIRKHPGGIEVEEVLTSYRARVREFYDWLIPALERCGGDELNAYRTYRRKLDGLGVYSSWSMMLSQVVIARKLDPYQYLSNYLDERELREVLALPHQSHDQVDRIIEIVDEWNACDDQLRALAYQAFGVTV